MWQVEQVEDSFAFLDSLEDGAVDVIITDPPYSVAKFSNRGETILDPFAGSGRIGEACVLLGRNYIGLDSDAAWVAKARLRLTAAECAPGMKDEDCLRLCAARKNGKGVT